MMLVRYYNFKANWSNQSVVREKAAQKLDANKAKTKAKAA
jgi:hypothetical protein